MDFQRDLLQSWLVSGVMILGLVGVASGQCEDIDGIDGQYCEDFEGDAFVEGENVTDADDWETWDEATGDGLECIVVVDPDDPDGDNQVIEVSTDNDIVRVFKDNEEDDDYYDGPVIDAGKWDIVAQTYVEGGVSTNGDSAVGYFLVLNTYNVGAGTLKNWSVQVLFDSEAGLVISEGGTGNPAVDGSVDLITDVWVEIRVEVDLDANEHTILYDGEEVASGPWFGGTGKAAIECVDIYGGTGTPTEVEMYYDDLQIFRDCNENNEPDSLDIEDEVSGDCNGDGIPDECQDTSVREIDTLVDSETTTGDEFGSDIAMDSGVLVVGSRSEDEGDEGGAGAVHVYRREADNPESWLFEQRLAASDGLGGDEFGYSVDVSGDVIVVGARRVDGPEGESSVGAAYVFEWDAGDGEWVEVAVLTAGDDAEERDEFGSSVAVDGDHIAVSAILEDTRGSSAGTVYTFQRCDDEWIAGDVLRPDTLGSSDRLGSGVDLSGNWLLAGAPRDDELGSNVGIVYAFEFDGSNWVESDPLLPEDAEGVERFGRSLAVTDNVAVIGAYLSDHIDPDGKVAPLTGAGKAFVFRRDAGAWVEEQVLIADDAESADEFGFAVGTSGDVIVVGASGAEIPNPDPDEDTPVVAGAAYVYACEDGIWTQQGGALVGSSIGEEEEFASAVATSGTAVAASALADDAAISGGGSTTLFVMPDCDFDEVPDACQIDDDPSLDEDPENGILDSCEDGVRRCDDDVEDFPGACGDTSGGGGGDDPEFIRGDANNDGTVSGLPDGLFLLNFQFVPGAPEPECADAADANGNNEVGGLTDGLYMFFFQFVPGSGDPPAPFPDCGVDPDNDEELRTAPDCETPPKICDE